MSKMYTDARHTSLTAFTGACANGLPGKALSLPLFATGRLKGISGHNSLAILSVAGWSCLLITCATNTVFGTTAGIVIAVLGITFSFCALGVCQRDANSQSRAVAEWHSKASLDTLTNIPNRRGLQTFLETRLNAGATRAMLVIDLDHFKSVNDTQGHLAGDEVLKSIAQTLTTICRKQDCAARLGGDEFVVVLTDVQLAEARRIGQRIANRIRQLNVSMTGNRVSASFGIAMSRADDTMQTLLARADAAMYREKLASRKKADRKRTDRLVIVRSA